MRTLFSKCDSSGNGKLSLEEFEAALAFCGLFPKIVDLKKLYQFYDVNGDGVCYNEFINGLSTTKLSKRQTEICEGAWKVIDKDGTGKADGTLVL